MDMLEGRMSWDEVALLARELEKAGASVISTHFMARVRRADHATMVPRAAFTSVTARVLEVSIPVITSNRINMPESPKMFLRKATLTLFQWRGPVGRRDFMNKAAEDRADELTPVLHAIRRVLTTHFRQDTSCLVNPRACHETLLTYEPTENPKKIAVVAQAPQVWLMQLLPPSAAISYPFLMPRLKSAASSIWQNWCPARKNFTKHSDITRMIEKLGIDLHLNTRVDIDMLVDGALTILSSLPAFPRVTGTGRHRPSVGYRLCRRATRHQASGSR